MVGKSFTGLEVVQFFLLHSRICRHGTNTGTSVGTARRYDCISIPDLNKINEAFPSPANLHLFDEEKKILTLVKEAGGPGMFN